MDEQYQQDEPRDPHQWQVPRGQRDAIDIDDFVYAATGARVRRLTMPDGTHWFPAVDVAGSLGYANTRDALRSAVPREHTTSLGELVRAFGRVGGSSEAAARHGLKRSMRLVDLRGVVLLVNRCTKPQANPFKAWVADVVATIQREGSHELVPSPVRPGYVIPREVVDILVRLERRNLRRLEDHRSLLRETNRDLSRIAASLERLSVPRQRTGPVMTPQELLASWRADHLAVRGDVHTVAACLAPALVRGGARYRLEQIAQRTGLAVERVRECVRVLVERGCVRQTGAAADGARIYLLP